MLYQTSQSVPFRAIFTASKQGKTGLTVTVDIWRDSTEIVTAGSATEIGDGIYSYTLASGSTGTAGFYVAVFKTSDSTVDQQWVYSGQIVGNSFAQAVPSANPGANGGLATCDSNNAVKLQSGTGANQISLSSGAVTVGTNNDKTGYSLTQAFPTNFSTFSIDSSGRVTANGVLGNVIGNVTGSIQGNVNGGVLGGGVFSLNSPGVMAILAPTDTTATTVATNLDTTVSSRLAASSYTAPPSAGSIAQAVLTDTTDLTTNGSIGKIIATNLDTTVSSRLASTSYSAPPSAGTIAQAVLTDTTDLTTAGSIGKIIATNLDTTVSSRLATTSYTAPDNSDIATALSDLVTLLGRTDPTTAVNAIKAVTDKVATMLATSGSNYSFTPDALKNAPTSQLSGTGDTPVNHDTGGTDNLRFVDGNGNGIDEATVTAFLASEYASNPLTATPRGQVFTKSDGRWVNQMNLDSGSYVFVFEAPGFQATTKTATVV